VGAEMNVPLARVLLIEDDPDLRTIAAMALEDIGGLSLTVCASGAEALTTVPTAAPQLILLDVMMPGMDGPMTLEALRRLPLETQPPVVFMTAKVQPQETQRYLALGAIDVIAKPFDPLTLADRLREIWHRL
jgi:two-component system OmpR family response regulator